MPRTILLVEDEYAAQEVLILLLKQEGYTCLAAADGVEALEMLASHPIDLVVTDYWMPRLDGLELCAHMQEDARWRHIPVILMSASTLESPLPPRAVGFLAKPMLFAKLLEMVKRTLGPAV